MAFLRLWVVASFAARLLTAAGTDKPVSACRLGEPKKCDEEEKTMIETFRRKAHGIGEATGGKQKFVKIEEHLVDALNRHLERMKKRAESTVYSNKTGKRAEKRGPRGEEFVRKRKLEKKLNLVKQVLALPDDDEFFKHVPPEIPSLDCNPDKPETCDKEELKIIAKWKRMRNKGSKEILEKTLWTYERQLKELREFQEGDYGFDADYVEYNKWKLEKKIHVHRQSPDEL